MQLGVFCLLTKEGEAGKRGRWRGWFAAAPATGGELTPTWGRGQDGRGGRRSEDDRLKQPCLGAQTMGRGTDWRGTSSPSP